MRVFHLTSRGLCWHKVQIATFVRIVEIGGGRNDLLAQRQHRDAGFQSAGAAQQVAGHRLGGADQHLVSVLAEGALHGGGFEFVAQAASRCRVR